MSIDFELSGEGIALITINRPERLNAMDAEHYQGLSQALPENAASSAKAPEAGAGAAQAPEAEAASSAKASEAEAAAQAAAKAAR